MRNSNLPASLTLSPARRAHARWTSRPCPRLHGHGAHPPATPAGDAPRAGPPALLGQHGISRPRRPTGQPAGRCPQCLVELRPRGGRGARAPGAARRRPRAPPPPQVSPLPEDSHSSRKRPQRHDRPTARDYLAARRLACADRVVHHRPAVVWPYAPEPARRVRNERRAISAHALFPLWPWRAAERRVARPRALPQRQRRVLLQRFRQI